MVIVVVVSVSLVSYPSARCIWRADGSFDREQLTRTMCSYIQNIAKPPWNKGRNPTMATILLTIGLLATNRCVASCARAAGTPSQTIHLAFSQSNDDRNSHTLTHSHTLTRC